jgi:hypothetical protein
MSNARSLIAELRRRNVTRMAFKAIPVRWGILDRRAEHYRAAGDGDVIHG